MRLNRSAQDPRHLFIYSTPKKEEWPAHKIGSKETDFCREGDCCLLGIGFIRTVPISNRADVVHSSIWNEFIGLARIDPKRCMVALLNIIIDAMDVATISLQSGRIKQ